MFHFSGHVQSGRDILYGNVHTDHGEKELRRETLGEKMPIIQDLNLGNGLTMGNENAVKNPQNLFEKSYTRKLV